MVLQEKYADYLAHLFQISIPLYSYLVCNALLIFFMHLYIYSPYPRKSIFRKCRFPVSPYPYPRIRIPVPCNIGNSKRWKCTDIDQNGAR